MSQPARPGGRTLLAVLLASPVHLLTVAVAALGVVLLWPGTTWVMKVVGALCVVVAYAIRPALGERRQEGSFLDLQLCPQTAALVREVAASLGGPTPTQVEVSSRPDADVRLSGLTGRVLSIGAPLWVALSGPERVALIAHQLGHLARGDVWLRRYVEGAVHSLRRWEDAVGPYRPGLAIRPQDQLLAASSSSNNVMEQNAANGIIADIVSIVLLPVRAVLAGYRRLVELVSAPSLRAEALHADVAATRAAGTDATVALLEVLLALPAIETSVNRAVSARSDVPSAITDRMAEFDAAQRRAVRNSTDAVAIAGHPPTRERLRLVESAERREPGVRVDSDRWATIDAELSAVVAKQLKRLADDYRYAH